MQSIIIILTLLHKERKLNGPFTGFRGRDREIETYQRSIRTPCHYLENTFPAFV